MDELNDIKKGCAKVHLNDGSFAQVPFDELSQFLIDNEHLTNNTQRCLRKRVASFAKKWIYRRKPNFDFAPFMNGDLNEAIAYVESLQMAC